jgi:hypothetical protein
MTCLVLDASSILFERPLAPLFYRKMTYPPVGDQWTLLPKETGRAFGLDQNTVF